MALSHGAFFSGCDCVFEIVVTQNGYGTYLLAITHTELHRSETKSQCGNTPIHFCTTVCMRLENAVAIRKIVMCERTLMVVKIEQTPIRGRLFYANVNGLLRRVESQLSILFMSQIRTALNT